MNPPRSSGRSRKPSERAVAAAPTTDKPKRVPAPKAVKVFFDLSTDLLHRNNVANRIIGEEGDSHPACEARPPLHRQIHSSD